MATKRKPKPKPKAEPKQTNAQIDEANGRRLAEEFYGAGSLPRQQAPNAIGKITLPGMITPISTTMEGGAESIAQAEDNYNKSRVRDQYVEEALKRGMASLSGFDAPENQALKAQAVRGINSNAATAQRSMQQQNAANGVTGLAAQRLQRQLQMDKQKSIAGANTDLAVANLKEKGVRLDAFGNLANTAAVNQAGIQDQALARLLGIRNDVAGYTQKSQLANQDAERVNASNTIDVNKSNADIEQRNIDNSVANQTYNDQQAEKEKSGYIGTMTGQMGVDEARRQQAIQNQLAKDTIKYAQGGGSKPSSKKKKKK